MEEVITQNPNQKLIDYLDFYSNLDNPQFAVLINGKWGSGKTFFIKNWICKCKEKSGNNVQDEDDNNIVLKPIYISLYGASTLSEVTIKIKEALNPFLYSKGAKLVKNIFFGVLKTATQINFDLDRDGKEDSKVSFDINSLGILKSTDNRIKGSKILVFDDLERRSIKLEDLFGYINEFVEHYKCKVILLSNEEKLSIENASGYKEFKEKLIGQTFTIQTDVGNAINSFICELRESSTAEFLQSSVDLIKSIFNASQIENLRILKQSILDFERFTKQFDDFIIQHEEYKKFLKSLLSHFLLVYLEYKSENQAIGSLGYWSVSVEEKKIESEINAKYDIIFDKFDIYSRTSTIQYCYVVKFINNGYTDIKELNTSTMALDFFRNSMDWERLWEWRILEDSEFDRIYSNVVKDFNNSKIKNHYVLLHVATILISLIEKEITVGNKSEIIESYKIQFDSFLKNSSEEMYPLLGEASWGKGYSNYESPETKELIFYSNSKIESYNSQHIDDYLAAIFETLNDDNFWYFQDKLEKSTPDRRSKYSYNRPILKPVNGTKLAECLLKLKTRNLLSFFFFLRRRYYPEEIYSNGCLESFKKEDKECLIDLKKRFETELSNLGRIKKHAMNLHIKALDEIILRLGNLEIVALN